MKVKLVSHVGQGDTRKIEVNAGISLQDFLRVHVGGAGSVGILVNGKKKESGYILEDGDKIVVSPSNTKAA